MGFILGIIVGAIIGGILVFRFLLGKIDDMLENLY